MEVVLLNSGGKDSLAAAIKLRAEGHQLRSLYVEMGQRNSLPARVMAGRIAEKYCDSHDVVTVQGDWVTTDNQGNPGVAFQAALLHVLAASYAVSHGIYIVASGQNSVVGPDFAARLNALLSAAKLRDPPMIILPLWGMDDAESQSIAGNDPMWRETVTCNVHPPCGSCGKCQARARWLGEG